MALSPPVGHYVELLQVARRCAGEQVLAEAQLGDADVARPGQQEDAEVTRNVLADPRRENLGARRVFVELCLEAIEQFGDLLRSRRAERFGLARAKKPLAVRLRRAEARPPAADPPTVREHGHTKRSQAGPQLRVSRSPTR